MIGLFILKIVEKGVCREICESLFFIGLQRRMMVRVTFYLKEGCWLCDATQEMVNGLKVKYDLNVTKVYIDSSDELYEMYRFDIPVLEFKDGSTLHGHIRKKDLLKKFEDNKE